MDAPTSLEDPNALPHENDETDIFIPTATAAPRFLGAAANEYRPVSGATSFSEVTTGSRNSVLLDETAEAAVPFFHKEEGAPTSPGYQFEQQNDVFAKAEDSQLGSGPIAPDVANRKRRNIMRGAIALILLALAAIAIILGIVLGTRHHRTETQDSASGILTSLPSAKSGSAKTGTKLWGVGGDTITTENGQNFVYNNTLGGTWVSIPLNDTAKPQGDQPSLAERWDYSKNRILGVNLGGWLVIEPFIVPSLFEPYADQATPVVDEWSLCTTLGQKAAATIEDHYNTFITEQDFAQIAAAGLNWVRLPVGWWMIETWTNEPLIAGVSFKYFLKAIAWARKYGLRINLDLHAVPGSQNGWNHSGKFGSIGFLRGAMGIANAQRTLNYVRTLTEFISQPQYKNVIPMFSVLNEAQVTIIGETPIRTWYYQVYEMLRSIGGTGEGNGPFMVIHDGFGSTQAWNGFLEGADRIGMDSHLYFCFQGQNTDTVAANSVKPCQQWAGTLNTTISNFGVGVVGEFSLAINDCGLFVNNVGYGERFEGTFPTAAQPDAQYPRLGSCTQWLDDSLWTADTKNAFADLAQTQQDVFGNSFFWTWKIGKSIKQNNIPNPMWNYQGGLNSGYIRGDARTSNGRCSAVVAAQGGTFAPKAVAGALQAWQTGGPGAGNIAPAQVSQYSAFPPAAISGAAGGNNYVASALPSYVATGTPVTLVPTAFPTPWAKLDPGSGWTQPSDTAKWWVPQAGCQYLDPWGGVGVAPPTPVCGNP
ncbi:hypothetical protein O181_031387 [Austropuccinia psidii MF-1]|uniref:glucan 1,3-beta-glucosidase n=1 Tax=Austropuccinia psidii MF-1 TaxID=1389203 RepID=A0A9Q3D0J4_9BASI|nr:hypothetical protein [Austropuccinia psidii MF-1]